MQASQNRDQGVLGLSGATRTTAPTSEADHFQCHALTIKTQISTKL